MNNYEINSETLAIVAYDNSKSKIIEKEHEFIINEVPTKIISDSCKYFGSSYEGRFIGTKNMLGISHKAPIIIEESRQIIFFPTSSPRLSSCTWISLNNVEFYKKQGNGTIIYFSTGKTIRLDLAYGIIDNQVLRATRLAAILKKRVNQIQKITF